MIIKYLEDGVEIGGTQIMLDVIIRECNAAKIKNQDLVLIKIGWSGRGGESYEHRTYPKDIAKKIKKLMMGKEVYLGEVWGKHSGVFGEIEERDFEIITDKKEVTSFLKENPSGIDCSESFIDSLIDDYHNGGREYYEKEKGKKWCNEIEELQKIS